MMFVLQAGGSGRRGPGDVPRPRSRWPFWFFVAAMALAVAGGGTIVLLVKRTSAEREAQHRASAQPARPVAPAR